MNENLKENLHKMLLTLGILSSLQTDERDMLRELFDYDVIAEEMVRLGDTFNGITNEFSISLAFAILADLYPEAYRSSGSTQTA